MSLLRVAVLTLLVGLTGTVLPAQNADSDPANQTKRQTGLTIPAGTQLDLVLTGPLRAGEAVVGHHLYFQSMEPLVVDDRVVIPPGTYVDGQLEALTQSGHFFRHADLRIAFSRLMFVDGYLVPLPSLPAGLSAPKDVVPAAAAVYVEIGRGSSDLLERGAEIELVFQLPLALDSARVAEALRETRPGGPVGYSHTPTCWSTPGSSGTMGTPDTVIPGTPATPDTVIPGGPGSPPTVIPGSPGTPGTVIPGTPATPGTPPGVACTPEATVVPEPAKTSKQKLVLSAPVKVSGQVMTPANYQVRWTSSGLADRAAEVHITGPNFDLNMNARVVLLNAPAAGDAMTTERQADGSVSLQALRFAGQTIALYF